MPLLDRWGTNGYVYALARYGRNLILGGQFTQVGPVTGSSTVADSGTSAPHAPWPRIAGTVLACASDGAGGWFLGGAFGQVDAIPVANLVHVRADGTLDPWAPAPNGAVRCLVRAGRRVFVGGDFTTIAGAPRGRFAVFDAATLALSVTTLDCNWTVNAIAATDTTVIVGGAFTTAGGAFRTRIAEMGLGAGALTAFAPLVDATVSAVLARGDTLFLGGDFRLAGTAYPYQYRTGLAAILRSTGAALPWNPGADGRPLGMAANDSTLYVVGAFGTVNGAARLHAAAFTLQTGALTAWNPAPDSVTPAVAATGRSVYLGGTFTSAGGAARLRIAEVDATNGVATPWAPLLDGTVNTIGCDSRRVCVGGTFMVFGGVPRRNLAQIDLDTGEPTPWAPTADHRVDALLMGGADSLFVGGSFATLDGQPRLGLGLVSAATGEVLNWYPTIDGGAPDFLFLSGGTLYAAGQFVYAQAVTRYGAAAFDVASQTLLPWNPSTDGLIDVLAIAPQGILAGGSFATVGGVPHTNLCLLDPVTAAPQPWRCDVDGGVVEALDLEDSVLVVGGDFTHVNGQPRNSLAAVNAVTGQVLPWDAGISGSVRAIHHTGSAVFAGGLFSGAGGTNFAAYDRTTLTRLPWTSQLDSYVTRIADDQGWPVVAGVFRTLDGIPRPSWFETTQTTLSVPAAPPKSAGDGLSVHVLRNPVAGAFDCEVDCERPGLAHLDVVDPQGRIVPGSGRTVRLASGPNVVRWAQSRGPAGVYWIRVRQGGRTAAARVVHLN